jgi:hypothetical protein
MDREPFLGHPGEVPKLFYFEITLTCYEDIVTGGC